MGQRVNSIFTPIPFLDKSVCLLHVFQLPGYFLGQGNDTVSTVRMPGVRLSRESTRTRLIFKELTEILRSQHVRDRLAQILNH